MSRQLTYLSYVFGEFAGQAYCTCPENRTTLTGMSEQDFNEVQAAVAALAGRTFTKTEWAEIYGLSRSAFYGAMNRDGELHQVKRLAIVAEHLQLNPVALFVELGAIELADVMAYAREMERKYEDIWGGGSIPFVPVPTRERTTSPIQPVKTGPLHSGVRRDDAPPL